MSKTKSQKLSARADKARDEIRQMMAAADTEGRDLTAEEHSRSEKLGKVARRHDAAALVARRAEKEERRETAARSRIELGIHSSDPNAVGGAIKVKSEQRTYERGNGVSYLRDLCTVSFGPGAMQGRYFEAVERLQRHSVENHVEATAFDQRGMASLKDHERYFVRQMVEARNNREDRRGSVTSYRALSTTAGAGGEFVPPLYLTADWIAYMRAGRVAADACHVEELPDGTMSVNIPKVSGGTSVATQGAQNTNVSDTDLQTEYVTVPVVTKAGQQIVSLQLLERSPIAFDQAVMQDLGKAYAQQIDQAVLFGPGSGDVTGILNTTGINTVTWTQATPTIKGLYGQIGLAKADVATSLFRAATHAFVTPTRWEWIGQSFDTNDRPLVVPEYAGPFNALAVSPDLATAEGPVGRNISGLNTFEDANIPSDLGAGTNQDLVVVSRMQENWLMESPIVSRALPQTYGNQLSVLLQLYGYVAFTAARYPNANSIITGTGLVAPTFNS